MGFNDKPMDAFDPFGETATSAFENGDFVKFDDVHHDSFGSGLQHSLGSGTHTSDEQERSPSSRQRRTRSSSPSRRGNRSRSKSRSPTSSSGRASLSNKSSRKGKRPSIKGGTSSSSKSKPTSEKKKNDKSSTPKHSGRRSSIDRDIGEGLQTPRGRSRGKDSLGLVSPTPSESSGSVSFDCTTSKTNKKASTNTVNTKSSSSSSSSSSTLLAATTKRANTLSSYSKLANKALSVWEMRQRFLQEFPKDCLPSDDVLRILYSPEKIEQIERVERFQKEHPGEPVPSDEVLKRLYATSNIPAGGTVPRPTHEPSKNTLPALVSTTSTAQSPRNGIMVRQDSGLTFATEREWEEWKSAHDGFSDFGIDEFGRPIHSRHNMEGIAEGEEDENGDNDQSPWANISSFHSSIGNIATRTVRKNRNPSLDVLKIGSNNMKPRKSSSQSLGSYNDKKTVMSDTAKSVTRSVHSRKTKGSDLPGFQATATNQAFKANVEQATNFDPFQVPSEHRPEAKLSPDSALGVDHLASLSFDNQRLPSTGDSCIAQEKVPRVKMAATIKKDKERNKGSKSREEGEKSSRKSRTSDMGDSSKRTSRTVSRNIGRAHSDNLGNTSLKEKKLKTKMGIQRTNSASAAQTGFDFETPPTFGFSGPNPFQESTAELSFADVGNASTKYEEDSKKGPSKHDFFEIAESAWGDDARNSKQLSWEVGPSNKEKRNSSNTARHNPIEGWMQEMPAFIANVHQKEEESDDDSGFDLALPGSKGDISPLTAYTRKPVRPMTRGRR
ncbi:hypothetical protein IV203_024673 [Nitzschia inconspicua]|uniref:Uncharacterized protein n=1 Tax=Nitzschia inconspicua TaxID=303405 RepID=A0A9K3K9F6_9STRA|nr:hypothetical protein IV203_024673 [Nitzschia inconspicua]